MRLRDALLCCMILGACSVPSPPAGSTNAAPDLVDLYFRGGIVRISDSGARLALYRHAIERNPGFVPAYLDLGHELSERGQHDEAIATFSRAIAIWPGNARLRNARGWEWTLKGEHESALADYASAIASDPKYLIPRMNRGMELSKMGLRAEAIAEFTAAIPIDEKNPWPYFQRGWQLWQKRDLDSALDDIDHAIQRNPKLSILHDTRASMLTEKGDFNQAISEFDTAIALDPQNNLYRIGRGIADYYTEAYEDASWQFSEAHRLDPTDQYAVIWRCLSWTKSGKTALASAELASFVAEVKPRAWPAPVLELFLDRRDTDSVLAAVEPPESSKHIDQVCEAQFYVAQFGLANHGEAAAVPLLQAVVRDCPADLFEHIAAAAYLGKRGKQP